MKDNKILVYVLVAVALVFLGVYIYKYNQENKFKLITNDEELGVFMQNMKEGDLEEYLAKKDELYAQDVYGGDTPEETLDMFIEALKAGDAELASKYFVLEKQREKLGEFESGLKSGGVNTLLDVIERREKKGDYYAGNINKFQFVVIGTEGKWDGVVEFTFDLVFNKQTKKWKMESL